MLPRDRRLINECKGLDHGLGQMPPIDRKGVSNSPPKPIGVNKIAAPAGPRNGDKEDGKAAAFNRREYRTREPASTAFQLREIAHAVRRIHDPLRSNPEAVLIAKDQIAVRLIDLAETMEAADG